MSDNQSDNSYVWRQARAAIAQQPAPKADTRKLCTCDGAGRGPGRACVVKAGGRLGELWRCSEGVERAERAAIAQQPDTLPPVEGDVLPPIGAKVLIHLASQDAWVEHTVAGYYVWPNHGLVQSVFRVFVRVRDRDGYLNARCLQDIRYPEPATEPEGAAIAQPAEQVAFNAAAQCSPTLTQCPRCNNPHHACDGGAQADAQPVAPMLLKGIGKINGDGWKDTTRIGDVVYAWNLEKPEPYAPGQFPRLGNPLWSASTQQYDFRAVPNDELPSVVDQVIEELRAEVGKLKDALAAPPTARQPLTEGEHHGLDTAERVCFYEQDFYVLSNFSSFRVAFDGQTFDTSEAAYHYQRFASAEDRRAILCANSAHDAFRYAQDNKHRQRADWNDVKVGVMRAILLAKVDQHEYVRRKLLATGDRELVENSWRDGFWGWGPNRDGQNVLGKLWMEIRHELRAGGITQEGE